MSTLYKQTPSLQQPRTPPTQGSSEEQVVRLHCAQTGEALTEVGAMPWVRSLECVHRVIRTSRPLDSKHTHTHTHIRPHPPTTYSFQNKPTHRARCTPGGSTSPSTSRACAGTPSTSTASPSSSTTGQRGAALLLFGWHALFFFFCVAASWKIGYVCSRVHAFHLCRGCLGDTDACYDDAGTALLPDTDTSPPPPKKNSDSAYPLEIIAVDMKKQLQHSGADGAAPTSTSTTAPPAGGGEGDESLASFLPTARLVKDLAAWHAEATREVPLSSSAMAATTAAALRPPASPSACLAPLSLRDDDGAGPAGRGEEEDEEAVLLLVTSAAAAAPAGGEAMEVDGEGSSSSSSSSAPKLFRVAAPVVCARCPAIRVHLFRLCC